MTNLDFSNAIHLTLRQWVGVGIFAAAMIAFAPDAWKQVERFEPGPDYRIPYDLGHDYWLYDRFARTASADHEIVLVGDSVIWGQYVKPDETLSHHLNTLAGKPICTNLGLDGAHPVALSGLIEHYGDGIRDRTVLLQCNPLWLSSPRHDLQVTEEFPFNHPRLVPQFHPWIACYRESISSRIGIVVERNVPFLGWTGHLQQAYFDQLDIPTWTLDHPYDNPITPLTHGLPPSDETLHHEPISWTARGITPQDFPWVDPEQSLQWRYFLRTVETLRKHGNRVIVLVGPFNEHMLTEPSRKRYQHIRETIEAGLTARSIPFLAPQPLASDLYGDASHPLAPGYKILARQLWPLLSGS